jgi:hypothetical protein
MRGVYQFEQQQQLGITPNPVPSNEGNFSFYQLSKVD